MDLGRKDKWERENIMSMSDAFTQASVGDVNTTIGETFIERVKDADGNDDDRGMEILSWPGENPDV